MQQPTLNISENKKAAMLDKLSILYGKEKSPAIFNALLEIIGKHKISTEKKWVDQNNVILITYADNIKQEGETPLKTLHRFLKTHVKDFISGVHILPFYPYSSDDGFSVIDYYKINPEFGNWNDIREISNDFQIMFDAVINHISAKSKWFNEYLKGSPEYQNFFIEADPAKDYSSVTRPRALPLLTEFETNGGKKSIWTTFSADQIDLNYKNEKVFLEIIDLLLAYVDYKASLLRIDAIGYMWKEENTCCINLRQAHISVQLMRDALDIAAPYVKIITETNVPHKDNISYFGNGHNEAHMVYNFSLPPLTLHSFLTGNAQYLSNWAKSLESEPQSNETTFFNFLASHDGIGVMPTKGILSDDELNNMIEKVKLHGGLVSYKNNKDGTKSIYELNINYLDALSHPDDPQELKLKRILAAHAILLSMRGVPAIYIHSLLGSGSFHKGVEQTGANRTINREKLFLQKLEKELNNSSSLRHKVFNSLKNLIQIRKQQNAFHPNANQKVLSVNPQVFALLRTAQNQHDSIISLVNVSNEAQTVCINLNQHMQENPDKIKELISGLEIKVLNKKLELKLEPYQVMWLKY